VLSPQQYAAWVVVRPQVWRFPVASAVNVTVSGGGGGRWSGHALPTLSSARGEQAKSSWGERAGQRGERSIGHALGTAPRAAHSRAWHCGSRRRRTVKRDVQLIASVAGLA